jgi:DisA bacterial checkpoint controller nucleotide-binding
MPPRSGEELKGELESRQDSRLVRALEMVAPGTALREGIDNILHAHTGGLIVIGDADELAFLFSGGIKLDLDYSPALLYELAKMDGAIVLSSNATKIAQVNVQLTPDPTILTFETGTRHRTAERVSKQTDALVVAISERREVVSLYVDGVKYILDQPGASQRREGEQRRRGVTARVRDEVGFRDLVAVALGQPVHRAVQQLWRLVLAVPAAVQVGVVQAEVGAQVDHPHAAGPQLRDQRRGGAVRVGDHGRVDLGVAIDVELLELHRHPVMGIDVIEPAPGVATRGDRFELEARVPVQQARRERAREPGGAEHRDARRHGSSLPARFARQRRLPLCAAPPLRR